MKEFLSFVLITLLSAVIACSEKSEEPPIDPEPDPISKKVLVIGIDGCMPSALVVAQTPNLDALMANGTYSLDARNERTTMSGPSWSSILTGAWEEKHMVADNSFSGARYDLYPHFFKRVKDKYPDSRLVSICEWGPINDYIASDHADIVKGSSEAGETATKAAAEMGVDQLTAMFLHFDGPDHAGHSTGFSPDNQVYLKSIEEVDQAIGEVITAMKSRADYALEDWAIIVTTDHGGIGYSHGGDSDEERNVFLIVSGDNIPQKEISKTRNEISVPAVENCLNSDHELFFDRETMAKTSDNIALNFGADQDFSIECRLRTNAPEDVHIVGKKDWVSGLNPGYVFSFKPSTKKFKINVGDGSNRIDIETEIISDNKWHTISATFDRDGSLSVYTDGKFSKSIPMSTIGNIDVDLPFTIGADGKNAYKFKGYIAEVRVFKTLLTGEEINDWSCTELTNTHSQYDQLLAHWKIIEGTGNLLNDSGPYEHHASLSGGSWKNAKEDHTEAIYDYSKTPRSVDVANTALNHLCIPIQALWKLDGESLINTQCD